MEGDRKQLIRRLTMLGAVILSLIMATSPAHACSVFATQLNGSPLIAKNFDWGHGDGFLVMNPRGQRRVGLMSDHTWTARYSSISLTVVGPGFPVSGMNEHGLVIETLVNNNAPRNKGMGRSLASLEWAQRQLDRHSSIAEVIRDVEQNGVAQVVLPLHFFVCQADGTCAVVEPAGRQSRVIYGANLPHPVLANNDFERDYPAARRYLGRNVVNRWFADSQASYVRLANLLDRQLQAETPRTVGEAFRWLDESAMGSLNVWQVLWQPQQQRGTVHLRESGRHFALQANAGGAECRGQPLVRRLNNGELGDWRRYSTADLPAVRAQLDQIIAEQGGAAPGFSQRVTEHTLNTSCARVAGR